MPMAFVLIQSEIGSEEEVLKELSKLEGVIEVYIVFGIYDIIAKIRADTMDNLKEILTRHIRRLNKVDSSLTMLVM
jgi:DNA-binding Lrp family transcriptional regulator